jgi:UDP-N-acetylmuramoylalanine--D-glutamate ligase
MAAAHLLAAQGWQVRANDRAPAGQLAVEADALPAGTQLCLGGHPLSLLEDVGLVVVSPGVPWDLPLLCEARRRGVEVIAEVELAWRALTPTPLLGVTGSNGKSTVTAMLGAILAHAGVHTGVGGNIGYAASALARQGGWQAIVLELSSFQLEGCTTLRPQVGVLLNLCPDHLDRHPDMAAYLAAKARLFAHQGPNEVAVLNADDAVVRHLPVPGQRALFSLADPRAAAHASGAWLVVDGRKVMRRGDLRLLGDHNLANALAAALAAVRFGIAGSVVAEALANFSGLPHRHQLVAEIRGVRWVDDSKGTNVGATAAGLAGYPPGTIHLILGGLGKGQDFTPLREAVAGRVARVYLIGAAAEEIATALAGVVPLERCNTLEVAVAHAAALARPGDTVLLSPACASFDQFRDYAHRGDEFARLAREVA